MFSSCPEGWEAVELGFAPFCLLWKRNGDSFAPSLLLVGIPARNPGILGREGPRMALAHIWEADDPQQHQKLWNLGKETQAMTTERKKTPGDLNEVFHP